MVGDSGGNYRPLLLSCSGACVLGQVANMAAIELAEENFGRLLCASGQAAGVPWILEALRESRCTVGIDGSGARCIQHAMIRAGFPQALFLTVEQLGIRNKPGFYVHTREVESVKDAVRSLVLC